MKKLRKVLPMFVLALLVIAVAVPIAGARPDEAAEEAPLRTISTNHLWDAQFEYDSGACGPWYNDVAYIGPVCGYVDFDDAGWISRVEDFLFSTMPNDVVFKIDISTADWSWSTREDFIITVGARSDGNGSWDVAYLENCGSNDCYFECKMTGFNSRTHGSFYADAYAIGAYRNGAPSNTVRVYEADIDVVHYYYPDDFTGNTCPDPR